MRELDVEPDEVVGGVEERVRERVGHVADGQHTAAANDVQPRARLQWGGRRRPDAGPMHHRRHGLLQQVHAGEHLVLRVLMLKGATEEEARAADHTHRQDGGDREVAHDPPAFPPQRAGHRAGSEERDRQRVHGRHQRAEP